MDNKHKSDSVSVKHRVITQLDRAELEFLDKLGKDALFASGHKLSYNEILECLVELAMAMGLSWESIDNLKYALKDKMIIKVSDSQDERRE